MAQYYNSNTKIWGIGQYTLLHINNNLKSDYQSFGEAILPPPQPLSNPPPNSAWSRQEQLDEMPDAPLPNVTSSPSFPGE